MPHGLSCSSARWAEVLKQRADARAGALVAGARMAAGTAVSERVLRTAARTAEV